MGMRGLIELREWLVETYNDMEEEEEEEEEDDDDDDEGEGSESGSNGRRSRSRRRQKWERIKFCDACKDIITIVSLLSTLVSGLCLSFVAFSYTPTHVTLHNILLPQFAFRFNYSQHTPATLASYLSGSRPHLCYSVSFLCLLC